MLIGIWRYRVVVVVVVSNYTPPLTSLAGDHSSTKSTIMYSMITKSEANTYMSLFDAHQVSSLQTDLPRGRILLLYHQRSYCKFVYPSVIIEMTF
jgi:hypothetical protein